MSNHIPEREFKDSAAGAEQREDVHLEPTPGGAKAIRAIALTCALGALLWAALLWLVF